MSFVSRLGSVAKSVGKGIESVFSAATPPPDSNYVPRTQPTAPPAPMTLKLSDVSQPIKLISPSSTSTPAATKTTTPQNNGVPLKLSDLTGSVTLVKKAGATSAPAAPAAPPQPAHPVASAIGGALKSVGKFFSSSENEAGNDIAGAIVPHLTSTKELSTQSDQTAANMQKIQQEMKDAQASGDTGKANQIAAYLRGKNVNVPGFNVEDIDPTLKKTNAQVVGDFAGVAADALSAGTYGEAAKGAEAGKLLTKAGSVAGKIAEKVGVSTTEQAVKTAGEQVIKKGAAATAKDIAKQAAQNAALGYAYDVSSNLKQNKTGLAALKPGAAAIAGAAMPAVVSLASGIIKGVAGKLSGAGSDVIQRAIDNPDAVVSAMRNYATNPEDKEQILNTAESALSDFTKSKQADYANAISKLQSSAPIPKSIVTDTFQKAVDKFGGKINADGDLVFGDSALTTADRSNLTNAWNDIKGWKDVTPQGMDTLRQNIGNNMTDFKMSGNPRANVVLGTVKSALTDFMSDKIPGYSDALKNYGTKSDTASEFLKEFQLAGKAKDTTKLNNLMKIFQKDPKIMDSLERIMGKGGAEEFQNQVAGSVLSNWFNPGKAMSSAELLAEGAAVATHHPIVAAATAAASSPRIVGETAAAAGKLAATGLPKFIGRTAIKALSRLDY